MKITDVLVEANLGPATLIKHNGSYFDHLIDKIKNGQPLEITGEYVSKFGESVVIDPKEIPRLLKAFYPNGDKSKAITNDRNQITNLVDKASLGTLLLSDGTTIPIGALYKSADFKSGSSYNKGAVAEGVLGAAVTAKFIAKDKKVDLSALCDVLRKLETKEVGGKGANAVEGNFEASIMYGKNHDKIKFKLKLAKNEYSPLVGAARDKERMDPEILNLIRSSLIFVNENKTSLPDAMDKLTKNKKSSVIVVTSDGLSNNTSTKADLHITIDGEIVNLISLKTKTKQFGQISGSSYEVFSKFCKEVFLMDISPWKSKFKAGKLDTDKAHNNQVILKLYEKVIGPYMESFFESISGKPKKEEEYIHHMHGLVVKHARGDENIDLVKLNVTSNSGYSLHRFDHKLLDLMKKIKFTSTQDGGAGNRKIIIRVHAIHDKKLEKELEGINNIFLIARSRMDSGYMRNILEMGQMLEHLSRIESSHFESRK